MNTVTVEECRRRLWHGLIPAVPVPCRADGQVDAAAQERYISYMARQPIAGAAVWAHTGRGLHLSCEQRIETLKAWTRGLGSEHLIVCGVGGSPQATQNFSAFVDSALEMAHDALGNGAHAFLIYAPSPLRQLAAPNDVEKLVLDYHRQLAFLHAPLILFYLYEAAGGISYSPELLRQLFALPEVVGIKLATLDSVMTYQNVANLITTEFPDKLLITGEDRFLGYSLMCGADAALIGMGSVCTGIQHRLMDAHFQGRAKEFLKLSQAIDQLSQVLFIPPMEGYIRRMLWTLVHLGVLDQNSAHDPWGPELPESEFVKIGETLRALGELPRVKQAKD